LRRAGGARHPRFDLPAPETLRVRRGVARDSADFKKAAWKP